MAYMIFSLYIGYCPPPRMFDVRGVGGSMLGKGG